jgi:hypothetical protein
VVELAQLVVDWQLAQLDLERGGGGDGQKGDK